VRFLFLGGFPPYLGSPHGANTKGAETLLAAWQEAERDLISNCASLMIAGPDAGIDRVARWRSGLQHPEQVYLAGILPPDMIPAYIRSSDVVLIPSMAEGLPNVAMEASACGRPVFGSGVGGIPEVVVHGETGLVLPAGDVAAWKNALVEYAGQASRLQKMGERARHRMEVFFDCRNYAPEMLDLYRAVLREPLD